MAAIAFALKTLASPDILSHIMGFFLWGMAGNGINTVAMTPANQENRLIN